MFDVVCTASLAVVAPQASSFCMSSYQKQNKRKMSKNNKKNVNCFSSSWGSSAESCCQCLYMC